MKRTESRMLSARCALLALFAFSSPSQADDYQTVTGRFLYGYAQQILSLVNEARRENGECELVMTEDMTFSAMKRASELAVLFSHQRPNGSSCYTAFPAVSYPLGENIAWGYTSPMEVMDGWMNSSGHRANILLDGYTAIGIGCFLGDDGSFFWVQTFCGTTGPSETGSDTRSALVDVALSKGYESIVHDGTTRLYTVRFNANGGSGSMADQTMFRCESAKIRANGFSRSGYVFIGWAKSPTGKVFFKNRELVMNLAPRGGETILYAVWAKAQYKVKFYANGGKGKMAVQKMTYGKARKLTANKFKREGYVFKGWATSKSNARKGKVKFKNKKSVKNLVTNGKTVKLYAVWKKK